MTEPDDAGEVTAEPDDAGEVAAEPDDVDEATAEAQEPPADSVEGPRRRARREREARREAQARAVAIEEARREAKRRVNGKSADDSKPLARGRVRGLKVLVWAVVLVVLFVGLGLLLYFTPIMAARNVVITEWDWAGGNFVHDEIGTDKRKPTVNANGPIYGTDDLNGHLVVLDPKTNTPSEVDIPGLDAKLPALPRMTGAMPHVCDAVVKVQTKSATSDAPARSLAPVVMVAT